MHRPLAYARLKELQLRKSWSLKCRLKGLYFLSLQEMDAAGLMEFSAHLNKLCVVITPCTNLQGDSSFKPPNYLSKFPFA